MNAIAEMLAEHRIIEQVVKAMPDAVTALDQGRRLNIEKLRGVVDFMRDYADRRHHQREEGIFFPLLIKRGVPAQGCPIGGLKNEHEKGRALVVALNEAITGYEHQDSGADDLLRQSLQNIISLYEKHIWMEDAMVFPMAEKLITEDDHEELARQFADLDRALGVENVARLEEFAKNISFQTDASVAAP